MAGELAKMRDWAVVNFQNRSVNDNNEQDHLEAESDGWETKAAQLVEGYAEPSEISEFRILGTYNSKGLPPLVHDVVHQSVYANMLKRRNSKFRNEISEQFDRLMKIVRRLESKPD